MLIQTSQLDPQQLNALDALCAACKNVDGNTVAIYRHLLEHDRQRPANVLLYKQSNQPKDPPELIGFLAAFFFSEHTCEMALMVAPEHRRQGIAKHLLKTLLPLLQSENVQHIHFSSPHELNDDWIPTLGMHYQHSEFEMLRSNHRSTHKDQASVMVRQATDADIPALYAIDCACFPTEKIDPLTRIHTLLHNPAHSLLIITQHDQTVGKAQLNWQPHTARLSDVGIMPEVQGRGLGTILLTHCINMAIDKQKTHISLNVETKNKRALHLYTHLGFLVENAHDYWRIDEFGLTGFLHPL